MESRCENCIIRQFNSLRALSKEELKKGLQCQNFQKDKKGRCIVFRRAKVRWRLLRT